MKQAVLMLMLLAAIVYSGVRIAHTGYEVRMLHASMEALRQAQDAALIEHAQLQLERGAVASLAATEEAARSKLSMSYPAERVELKP